jgi:hypothetical protein
MWALKSGWLRLWVVATVGILTVGAIYIDRISPPLPYIDLATSLRTDSEDLFRAAIHSPRSDEIYEVQKLRAEWDACLDGIGTRRTFGATLEALSSRNAITDADKRMDNCSSKARTSAVETARFSPNLELARAARQRAQEREYYWNEIIKPFAAWVMLPWFGISLALLWALQPFRRRSMNYKE